MTKAVKQYATWRGDLLLLLGIVAFLGICLAIHLGNKDRNAKQAEYCAAPNETGKTRLGCLSRPVQLKR